MKLTLDSLTCTRHSGEGRQDGCGAGNGVCEVGTGCLGGLVEGQPVVWTQERVLFLDSEAIIVIAVWAGAGVGG